MSFRDLGLSEEVLRAVSDAGYSEPTPIQQQAIPQILMGRDILGCAQTGTGKTASFTLPMIDVLAAGRARARMPRSLILEPTRELAAQVSENFEIYGKYNDLDHALIIGGESMSDQTRLIDRGVDVLIATPGRLIDVFERGGLLLTDVKILVIDEADRMLDMGFIPDVERIVGMLPKIRQTLFFSATMPPEIRRLADAFLMNPKEITVARLASTAELITQRLIMVDTRVKERGRPVPTAKLKRQALRDLIKEEKVKNALIFCNRKRDVDIVFRSLTRHGFNARQLHGDLPQSKRVETMEAFKRGDFQLLVCSDVAARGLDIHDMSHVFNFDVPTHAEDYVHRIGRTGRAGREGRAFTIATAEDTKFIRMIEQLIGNKIPRDSAIEKAPSAEKKSETEAPAALPSTQSESTNSSKESDDGEGGPATPERESRSRRGRRGKGRKADKQSQNDGQREGGDRDESKRPQRPDRKEPREKVVGMGDHMPAFLKRPIK
jgi:superfamily II DNA/RNA helicase